MAMTVYGISSTRLPSRPAAPVLTIDHLPVQGILQGCFSFLDYQDLCTVHATCMTWKRVALTEGSWNLLVRYHFCLRPHAEEITPSALKIRKIEGDLSNEHYRIRLLGKQAVNRGAYQELQSRIVKKQCQLKSELAPYLHEIKKLQRERQRVQEAQVKRLIPLQERRERIRRTLQTLTLQVEKDKAALRILSTTVGMQASTYLVADSRLKENEKKLITLNKQLKVLEQLLRASKITSASLLGKLDTRVKAVEKMWRRSLHVRTETRMIEKWSQRLVRLLHQDAHIEKELVRTSRETDLPVCYRYFRNERFLRQGMTLRESLEILARKYERGGLAADVSHGRWLSELNEENAYLLYRALFKAQYPVAPPDLDVFHCGQRAWSCRFRSALTPSVFLQRISPETFAAPSAVTRRGTEGLPQGIQTSSLANGLVPTEQGEILPEGGIFPMGALRVLPDGGFVVRGTHQTLVTDRLGRFRVVLADSQETYTYMIILPPTNQQIAQALKEMLQEVTRVAMSSTDDSRAT